MKINVTEKGKLQKLTQSAEWELVQKIAFEYINEVQQGSAIGKNGFETIKKTIIKETTDFAIKQFLNKIEELGND